MPDHVKHDIFSVDRETMNDKVLKVHHDSMVDVLESFDVKPERPTLNLRNRCLMVSHMFLTNQLNIFV
ncbi:hypothetical protein HanXRQr2_Chr14g0656311 [Helianthus annuus]|uniref:Uncharacterized protein n=2 Tax=Helianthus annuus TaxID=4232 RepID=A0A9K3H779_HELAN|nr:hypothetical protein HanXRQr2_Chr14g0656311 [Helianthus annuus]